MMGLEPTTFCMASRRSSQLSYIRESRSIAAVYPGLGPSDRYGFPALPDEAQNERKQKEQPQNHREEREYASRECRLPTGVARKQGLIGLPLPAAIGRNAERRPRQTGYRG
jgi:hypothetical protein